MIAVSHSAHRFSSHRPIPSVRNNPAWIMLPIPSCLILPGVTFKAFSCTISMAWLFGSSLSNSTQCSMGTAKSL
jgi:hypothetical protein